MAPPHTSDRKLTAFLRLLGHEPTHVTEQGGVVVWTFADDVDVDDIARQFAQEARLQLFASHLLRSVREVGIARRRPAS